jgi:hypothetical protein
MDVVHVGERAENNPLTIAGFEPRIVEGKCIQFSFNHVEQSALNEVDVDAERIADFLLSDEQLLDRILGT